MDGCNLLQTQASFKKREQRDNSQCCIFSVPARGCCTSHKRLVVSDSIIPQFC